MENKKRLSFEDEIKRNKIKSSVLMIIIVAFFIFFGYIIAMILDPSYFFIIMIFSIIISISYTLIGYYNAEKIALASVNARPASRAEHPQLFHAVENMAIASGLPVPKVYVMESNQINAFASGRNPEKAVICITTGALKKLNKQELEGVIAHEMSHIANYDIRFMTLTAILIGLISIVAQMFLRSFWFGIGSNNRENKNNAGLVIFMVGIILAILAPLFANLVALAISRKREYGADAMGVKLTRYPPGLKNALIKIKNESVYESDNKRYSKAIAPLFISDPFKRKIKSLFSTHPPLEERISKLERM